MFVQKIFQKKKFEKILKIILAIFFYLKKKFGWNSVNFQKKNRKNFENNFCNFFIFEKKSVKSRLIHQSKDRKLSVKMSVNLG